MGLVTDIHWKCPGCGEANYAQCHGGWDDPMEGYQRECVPRYDAHNIKWNPPCKKCGKYKLHEPKITGFMCMEFEPVRSEE